MQVDFYHLGRDPLDRVLASIATRVLAGGGRLLVITQDETGREVEYYHFAKFKNPAGLKDADFDPSRLQTRRK